MTRRVSSSQLRSKMQQLQQKQRQLVNDYNRAVRNYNQQVNNAINQYNQAVRAYNADVRARRQRIKAALSQFQRKSTTTITTTHYVTFRTSVQTMHQAYVRLENRADNQWIDPDHEYLFDLSEQEAANNLEVMNALLEDGHVANEGSADELQQTGITTQLGVIAPDLDNRWRGALFSLNPRNPDAARHFCTSAREVFTQILDIKAPDAEVLSLLPECEKTSQGKPTRRAKIQYFLRCKGMMDDTLEEFVEEDMSNIVQLFRVFNDGTHGTAGRFDFRQLSAIKKRVEDGILFLSKLVN